MSTNTGKLTRKQESLIAALLSEKTHASAASKAGISLATLQRWLNVPAFKAAYRQARRALVEAAVGQLQGAASDAVEALKRSMTCGRPADETRAALGVLDHAVKAVELLDLAERVEELEALVKELTDGEADQSRGQDSRSGSGAGVEEADGSPAPAVSDDDLEGVA
jgi:hypothetical protein